MKQIFVLISALTALHACASSPYITTCKQPACAKTAQKTPFQRTESDGTKVVINADFSFAAQKPIKTLIHQDDILIITFPNGSKVATATLSMAQFGLKSTQLNPGSLMDMAFQYDFDTLRNRDLSRQELHTIRAIKLEAMKDENATIYSGDGVTIYFYSEDNANHKAYIVTDKNASSWVMLDFYDSSLEYAKKLLFTTESY